MSLWVNWLIHKTEVIIEVVRKEAVVAIKGTPDYAKKTKRSLPLIEPVPSPEQLTLRNRWI